MGSQKRPPENMERFNSSLTLTSSEAAELLAVHPSTVKRWCNEGDLQSEKTEGGHRRLRLGDVMDFARKRAIDNVLMPFEPYEPHVWSALREIREEGSFRRFHSLAMGWVHRGDLRRLARLYDALARDPSVRLCQVCDLGIRGLMQRVGEEWAAGRLRVGEEHLVSQVMVEVLLNLRVDDREKMDRRRNGAARPVAVVGTLEGNFHHLGSLCVRLLLERLGWEVYYLGPDVPIEDFGVIQRGREASLVCLSLTPPAAAGDVARAIRILGGSYDRSRPYALAFGGQVQGAVDDSILQGPFVGSEVFPSCESLRMAIESGFAGSVTGAQS